MTHSAAQQVLLRRLGIATLQLHPQFGSVFALPNTTATAVVPVAATDVEALADGTLLNDLQQALRCLDCKLQPMTHSNITQVSVTEEYLLVPIPLNAAAKRQLWQLLSSLDH